MFNLNLESKENFNSIININKRVAVRAVIYHKDQLLMINTNKGDNKFPGGGIEKNETHHQALTREVMEETGYLVNKIIKKIGKVTSRKIDDYDQDSIFEMTSHYYLCSVKNKTVEQKLEAYEKELNYKPKWIEVQEAIKINNEVLKKEAIEINPWVLRETLVLKKILSDE